MANGEFGLLGEPAVLNAEVAINREPESVIVLGQIKEELPVLDSHQTPKTVQPNHAQLINMYSQLQTNQYQEITLMIFIVSFLVYGETGTNSILCSINKLLSQFI